MQPTSLKFADIARTLGQAARLRGLVVPSFRTPPRLADVQRSIRRREGAPSVAVRIRGRPWAAVVADMIEGVVVGNELTGKRADQIRLALWLATDYQLERSEEAATPQQASSARQAAV